ncbi:hypothetical protein RRU01S_18_00330 [Agrobacterium rubi TR3 = NBRC 13261]|uniref:Uncharacterized protein n=1 Tax=Agrobacterium rubi TR3 = NBRC 13261 TaxID=1368415 RepID=A0A081CY32_9HYPH|nr:hypothetical protein [Agrobacterium rubi]GAK71578.1 hypothetical protein RRU01S_18_00330 [Agrobacterium rubi TR3 = NBRC 13261]
MLAAGWVELAGAVELWLAGVEDEEPLLVVVPDELLAGCVLDDCPLGLLVAGVDFGGKSASNMGRAKVDIGQPAKTQPPKFQCIGVIQF